jgi:hypothetical protein
MIRRRMGEWWYSSAFLDLGTRWRWVVSFTPLLLFSLKKEPLVPVGQEDGWTPEPVRTIQREETFCTSGNQTWDAQPKVHHDTDWTIRTSNKTKINLASYDAVNRNRVPICQLSLFIFLSLTTCFGPYRPSSGENIQLMLYEDYSYYHGSTVRTQLDVRLYWYFDPWSPVHVIKHKI